MEKANVFGERIFKGKVWQGSRAESFFSADLKKELVRKNLHVLIAFVPLIARFNDVLAMSLLASGVLVYSVSEYLRHRGHSVPFISRLTALASRKRDEGHFVMGPVTLALGAMLALLFYPHPAASIGIYALAFGDGLSSLVGKWIGSVKIPYTGGKTLEGSLTCWAAVFLVSSFILQSTFYGFLVGLFAALIEILPLKDMDNVCIPLFVGFFVEQILLQI